MIKRISCKVIKTIPLSNNDVELRRSSESRSRSHKIKNTPGTPEIHNDWEAFTNPQAKDLNTSVIYTNRMNVTRIPTDNIHLSSNLNYYA